MKDTLERLFLDTLDAISLDRVLPGRVRRDGARIAVDDVQIDLSDYDRVMIAAIGKAAYSMAGTLVELLSPWPVTGLAVGPTQHSENIKGIETIRGRHPYPDAGSLRGASALLEKVGTLRERDLLICLLSGGGSSLVECPADRSMTLDDLATVHRLLVTGGANIVDMNVVRKHLSGIKGGRLAAAAAPARQITLYVSDVPIDSPSAVASGPTMPDESTLDDMNAVIERLGIADRLPGSVRRLIDSGRLVETPKPDAAFFGNCSWHCVIDNGKAVEQLRERAERIGWRTDIDLSVDDWPLADAVTHLLGRLRDLAASHPQQTICLVTGGELSCPVLGDGQGGRNSAFVLRAAMEIGGQRVTVLSAGTDGIDGNSPAAGATADGRTLARAKAASLSAVQHERDSDAYGFFHALGDDITTGPTGNNVRDLRLLVHDKSEPG